METWALTSPSFSGDHPSRDSLPRGFLSCFILTLGPPHSDPAPLLCASLPGFFTLRIADPRMPPSCFKLYSPVFSLPLKVLTLHPQALLAPKSLQTPSFFPQTPPDLSLWIFFINEYLLSVYYVPCSTVLSISNCIL